MLMPLVISRRSIMENTQEPRYFDLIVKGTGYLNRPREVNPKNGKPYLACSIRALRGDASAETLERTDFDVRVTGKKAQELVRQYMGEVKERKKVLMGFRIGDIVAKSYVYSTGDKAGQTGVVIDGRLILITYIKVDGKLVYRLEKDQATDEEVKGG
jgi:hypothetical protein